MKEPLTLIISIQTTLSVTDRRVVAVVAAAVVGGVEVGVETVADGRAGAAAEEEKEAAVEDEGVIIERVAAVPAVTERIIATMIYRRRVGIIFARC